MLQYNLVWFYGTFELYVHFKIKLTVDFLGCIVWFDGVSLVYWWFILNTLKGIMDDLAKIQGV